MTFRKKEDSWDQIEEGNHNPKYMKDRTSAKVVVTPRMLLAKTLLEVQ